eukprot:3933241-Rhodomonas_salina.2
MCSLDPADSYGPDAPGQFRLPPRLDSSAAQTGRTKADDGSQSSLVAGTQSNARAREAVVASADERAAGRSKRGQSGRGRGRGRGRGGSVGHGRERIVVDAACLGHACQCRQLNNERLRRPERGPLGTCRAELRPGSRIRVSGGVVRVCCARREQARAEARGEARRGQAESEEVYLNKVKGQNARAQGAEVKRCEAVSAGRLRRRRGSEQ